MTKKKIQVVLSEHDQKSIAFLIEATGAESMAHVLRDALGVYDALNDLLRKAGPESHLAIIDRAKLELQAIQIPSLDRGRQVVVAGAPVPIRFGP